MNSIKISNNVIDEMFPEGSSGNMLMELDEVVNLFIFNCLIGPNNYFLKFKN